MICLFQARGPKKHLKRLNAPKAWMLDKLGGVYAPRPSTGPHKLRESLPLVIFLRNRLKYALTNCEVKKIVKQRLVKVDGKIRTDPNYPAGFMVGNQRLPIGACKRERECPSREPIERGVLFGTEYSGEIITDGSENMDYGAVQAVERVGVAACTSAEERYKGRLNSEAQHDVITIEKTAEYFRLIYDVKGRFTIHRISSEEAKYKLCKVKRVQTGPKGIPFLVTHDGRTIRYPDPVIRVNDTVQLDIATSKIMDSIKFESGNLCMITGGRNLGRVGTVVNRERHPGSFDIVHIKDSQGHTFATR
uniref:40S ribosomal protein S4 n=1 Tax=Timema genevievae TaxID=629358 RepID=A0A7R9K3F1_TIMGE|nr:unnamed protein product [Timema genevievae]